MAKAKAISAALAGMMAISTNAAFAADKTAIPDFAGFWARTSLGFESPKQGRGPIRNRNLRAAGNSNFSNLAGDYTDPLLKPRAAGVLKRLGEVSARNEAFPQPSNQCLPYPTPYVWSNNQAIEVLQQKDRVTILTMFDHQFRAVRLNAKHPAKVTPSWYGDSIGHYEGGTLVVDTVGIKPGPYPMVDIYGTPFSPALHVVERFHLVDNKTALDAQAQSERENQLVGGVNGDGVDIDRSFTGPGLQVDFTVEDPNLFNEPWNGTVTFFRGLDDWAESVCAENTSEYYANKDTAIPAAARPEF